MSMLISVLIGLLCMFQILILFILSALELNEYVAKEVRRFIGNKNIEANLCSVQADNSIMCG